MLIKSELLNIIAMRNPHLSEEEAACVVSTIFEEITEALAEGKRVELRGFGTFSIKKRPARYGRNPKTGAPVLVEEKWAPVFKCGKALHDLLNRV